MNDTRASMFGEMTTGHGIGYVVSTQLISL